VKSYIAVQTVYAPGTFPNAQLENVLLSKIDPYIKEGKCTVADSWGEPPTPGADYRWSARSNRPHWDDVTNQIFYRIFFDQKAADNFIRLNLFYGAKEARIVTESDIGRTLPDSMTFPDDEFVSKFIWQSN
jgi:hypothetical protein